MATVHRKAIALPMNTGGVTPGNLDAHVQRHGPASEAEVDFRRPPAAVAGAAIDLRGGDAAIRQPKASTRPNRGACAGDRARKPQLEAKPMAGIRANIAQEP